MKHEPPFLTFAEIIEIHDYQKETKMLKIYLDLNIYRHILEGRCNHKAIFEKIQYLKKQGAFFPYSPAHMEEIGVMFRESSPNCNLINRHVQLIKEISSNKELLPGRPSLDKIYELRCMYKLLQCPISLEIKKCLDDTEQEWLSGQLSENDLKTRLIVENPCECLRRVLRDLGITDFALTNEVFHMGRKNRKSVMENFAAIGCPNNTDIVAFDELRKKNNINVVELNNICGKDVFAYPGVLNILRQSYTSNRFLCKNIPNDIPRGDTLLNNHEILEDHVTICMNVLDKAGYFSDKQNDVLKLRSRMHDITHAIYGASTNLFVTDDARYAKRLMATYSFLEIPTNILNSIDFVHNTEW